jgi:hypothetical protein
MNLLIEFCSTGEALPWRVQDPRGMNDYTLKAHTKKVVYRTQPTGQLKGEPELLRKEVPRSSGKIQKQPKRSLKSESRHSIPSDRGTPDSLPDSGPIDEYLALQYCLMMLEENFALDRELSI